VTTSNRFHNFDGKISKAYLKIIISTFEE